MKNFLVFILFIFISACEIDKDNILLKRSIVAGIEIQRDNMIVANGKIKREDIIILDHGNIRYISDYIQNKFKYDMGVDGIKSLNDVKFDVIDISKNIKEVRVNSFDTGESLDSLFVKTGENIDISKRPQIMFDKQFDVGHNNKLYIPHPSTKKTMLFNTFKTVKTTNNSVYKKTNNSVYKKTMLFNTFG